LITAVTSVKDQVDKVYVALNGYTSIPLVLAGMANVECGIFDNSLGDAMKMWKVSECEGYYLSIDDDLKFPSGYVQYMIDGVNRYNGLVSLHGKTYLTPVKHFKQWAGNYRCLSNVSEDVKVNMIGSGCCAFDTSRLKLSLSDFKSPNMADCYLSKVTFEQGVPMVVLKHSIGYLQYLHPKGMTIWDTSRDCSRQTSVLQSYLK
jgi:hypothetical protein